MRTAQTGSPVTPEAIRTIRMHRMGVRVGKGTMTATAVAEVTVPLLQAFRLAISSVMEVEAATAARSAALAAVPGTDRTACLTFNSARVMVGAVATGAMVKLAAEREAMGVSEEAILGCR